MDLAGVIENIEQIRNELRQKWVNLQIAGRELTQEEIRESEKLDNAVALLDSTLEVLLQDIHILEDEQLPKLKDGRFNASHAQFKGEIRVDLEGGGLVSMDIFHEQGRPSGYVASLRNLPGQPVSGLNQPVEVIIEDNEGNVSTGSMQFYAASSDDATLTLEIDEYVQGLPIATPIVFALQRAGDVMRRVGLEIEREQTVEPLPSYQLDGESHTVQSSFLNAGLELVDTGRRSTIPLNAGGWDDAQLHGLMTQFAQSDMQRKDWVLHLLLLTKFSNPRVLGVMFDTGEADVNQLPRQGAAVFTEPMANHPAGFARKVIQTTVHELGHALNLAHRFERIVGRANSTSFMNYDWRYMGGGRQQQYWQDFQFTFDDDEVRFMRHAPWKQIVPGGAEFHTVRYWADGTGGYTPYFPEEPVDYLRLELLPPPSGTLFGFGSPVFLTVRLINLSGQEMEIPDFFLDVKGGLLNVSIERLNPSSGGNAPIRRFHPVSTRCYDLTQGDRVAAGGAMTRNINLTFGATGFSFAEPGNYRVRAVISIPNGQQQKEFVVKSNPLDIRVAFPRSRDEELDALDLFTPEVGMYFALGGSDVLNVAEQRLQAVKDRRQKKDKEISDPLVAYIVRCEAINAARDFYRMDKGQVNVRQSKTDKALKLLKMVLPKADSLFDEATAEGTKHLYQCLDKR